MGLAVGTAGAFLCSPSNFTKIAVIIANLIVIGLAIWWNAYQLFAIAAVKILLVGGTFCFGKGFLRTLLYFTLLGLSVLEVVLFRATGLLVDPSVTFGNVFADWALGPLISLIKGIPEGVSYFTLGASVFLLVLSFCFDQVLSPSQQEVSQEEEMLPPLDFRRLKTEWRGASEQVSE